MCLPQGRWVITTLTSRPLVAMQLGQLRPTCCISLHKLIPPSTPDSTPMKHTFVRDSLITQSFFALLNEVTTPAATENDLQTHKREQRVNNYVLTA